MVKCKKVTLYNTWLAESLLFSSWVLFGWIMLSYFLLSARAAYSFSSFLFYLTKRYILCFGVFISFSLNSNNSIYFLFIVQLCVPLKKSYFACYSFCDWVHSSTKKPKAICRHLCRGERVTRECYIHTLLPNFKGNYVSFSIDGNKF